MSHRRKVTVYLILARDRSWGSQARVVKKSKHKPRLERGQCAVKLTISVPDAAFEPVFDAPEQALELGEMLRANTVEIER